MTNPQIDSIVACAQQAAQEGDLEHVEQALKDGLKDYPESTELLGHLGYFYVQQKRWRRAENVLSKLLKTDRENVGAKTLLKEVNQHLKPKQVVSTRSTMAQQAYYQVALTVVASILRTIERFNLNSTIRFSLGHFYSTLRSAPPKTQQACLAYHKAREILIASQAMPLDQPTAKILDLGSGNNSLPVFWSRLGCDVVALDGSLYGFDGLKKVQINDGGEARFACGDVTSLPFGDNLFDGVSALCMIEHLPYNADITAMKEIHRVLKPGGVAAITVESNREQFDEWIELPYEIGFQKNSEDGESEELFCRNYSQPALTNRLVGSTVWEALSVGFFDDRLLPFRHYFNQLQPSIIRSILRPFQPVLSLMFYRLAPKPDTLSPSSIGFAVLRKPL